MPKRKKKIRVCLSVVVCSRQLHVDIKNKGDSKRAFGRSTFVRRRFFFIVIIIISSSETNHHHAASRWMDSRGGQFLSLRALRVGVRCASSSFQNRRWLIFDDDDDDDDDDDVSDDE